MAAEDSLIGLALDNKYRVIRVIGRGGMGVVYEAEHVTLGKRVAIKLMLEKYTDDSEAVARFSREALAASRIGNPHIIDVMDIGTAPDGRAFVVMELLEGRPLSHVIDPHGPMAPARAISIMRQVLRAVGAAHAKGIVHRDLKPDNIFLLDNGDSGDFVKLLDFGISKMIDPDLQVAATKLTTTGVVMGTPLYMAPEQAMGADIDHLADVYACGVILYEMLAGRPPFEGATYAVLVAKLLTTEPPLITELRPGLSARLVTAVHRALAKEPRARFATAEAFAAALPQAGSVSALELGTTLDSGRALAVPGPAKSRRWPILAASLAMLAGVATATAILVAQGRSGTTTEPAAGPGSAAAEGSSAPPVATGILEVRSRPIGATVFIDGKERGATPTMVTLLPGKHDVRVVLLGFTAEPSSEEVLAHEKVVVTIPMQPVPDPVASGADPKAGGAGKPGSRPGAGKPKSNGKPAGGVESFVGSAAVGGIQPLTPDDDVGATVGLKPPPPIKRNDKPTEPKAQGSNAPLTPKGNPYD